MNYRAEQICFEAVNQGYDAMNKSGNPAHYSAAIAGYLEAQVIMLCYENERLSEAVDEGRRVIQHWEKAHWQKVRA